MSLIDLNCKRIPNSLHLEKEMITKLHPFTGFSLFLSCLDCNVVERSIKLKITDIGIEEYWHICRSQYTWRIFFSEQQTILQTHKTALTQTNLKFTHCKILTNRLELLTDISIVLRFFPTVLDVFHRLAKYFHRTNSRGVGCLSRMLLIEYDSQWH